MTLPKTIQLTSESITFSKGEKENERKFAMVAYTGGSVPLGGGKTLGFDVSSMKIPTPLPIRLNHDSAIGMATEASVADGKVLLSGVIFGDDPDGAKVIRLGDHGFPWKASIGVRDVNPTEDKGGKYSFIAKNTTLDESSFTDTPVDRGTVAVVMSEDAQEKPAMDKEAIEKLVKDTVTAAITAIKVELSASKGNKATNFTPEQETSDKPVNMSDKAWELYQKNMKAGNIRKK